jgi:arylsulfatase A
MLKEKHYHTGAIGKWHLGWNWKDYLVPGAQQIVHGKIKTYSPEAFDWTKPITGGPTDHGFDVYFGDAVINFPPYAWIENDRVTEVPTVMLDTSGFKKIKEGGWECRSGPMIEGWNPYDNIPVTTQRGVDYITQQAGKTDPFFLYFAFPSPHAPIIPNDEFDGKSGAGAYGDFVCETDHAVGRLIQALKDTGQYENTVIILTSDNGAEMYAYARDRQYGHWSSYPLRGVKQDLYEGGHRVPFIVRWPGITPAGSVCDEIVSQIDIMGTLSAYLGIELPEGQAEDSLNLLPLFKGKKEPVREALVYSTWKQTGFGLRLGDWVLINEKTGYARKPPQNWEERYGIPADDESPVELYNLKNDIMQKNNLADQFPEQVSRMQQILADIHAAGMAGR